MVANIRLSYTEIERVSGLLDTAVDVTLLPRMKEAKQQVDDLLAGALVLEKTTPALSQQYEKFNTGLTQAADAVKGFAKQFRAIKAAVQNMDSDMAGKINSNG
ncbi:hypothetical protein EF918_22000 [Streptomyces sp. WAC06614]|nr:hypothetical protein EF918_22000 [Streptomyces sp. WAC06614]